MTGALPERSLSNPHLGYRPSNLREPGVHGQVALMEEIKDIHTFIFKSNAFDHEWC